eukprot:8033168-Pyramimonas_sp.AAC.1
MAVIGFRPRRLARRMRPNRRRDQTGAMDVFGHPCDASDGGAIECDVVPGIRSAALHGRIARASTVGQGTHLEEGRFRTAIFLAAVDLSGFAFPTAVFFVAFVVFASPAMTGDEVVAAP